MELWALQGSLRVASVLNWVLGFWDVGCFLTSWRREGCLHSTASLSDGGRQGGQLGSPVPPVFSFVSGSFVLELKFCPALLWLHFTSGVCGMNELNDTLHKLGAA